MRRDLKQREPNAHDFSDDELDTLHGDGYPFSDNP